MRTFSMGWPMGGNSGQSGLRRYWSGSGHHGGLRRAVVVDQREGQAGRRIVTEDVATRQQGAQNRRARPFERDQLFRQGRGCERDGDVLVVQPVAQRPGRPADVGVRKVQAGAGGKVGPNLPDRGIEAGRGNLAGIVGCAHLECAMVPTNEVQQAGVRDLDAQGTAGGPGGVGDIRQVVWPGCGQRLHGRAEAQRRFIQRNDFPLSLRQAAGDTALGQDERRLHIAQHEFEPFGRIGRVEGDVARAGFQNRQRGQDAGGCAISKDGNGNVAAYAQQLQTMGESRGALIELAVAQTEGSGGQSQRVMRLRGNHASDREVLRNGVACSSHIDRLIRILASAAIAGVA